MKREVKNIFNNKLANCYIDVNAILEGKVRPEEINKVLTTVKNDLLFLYDTFNLLDKTRGI